MSFSLFNIHQKKENTNQQKGTEQTFSGSVSEKYAKLINTLDEYQRTIVTAPASESMCCIAGPGSGKTKTIISRAIKLVYIDKVDPTKIVLITFTNKAAKELKQRYVDFFKEEYKTDDFPTPHISTIHSFCLYQIRKTFGFPRTILSEYLSFKLFKEVCRKVCPSFGEENFDVSILNKFYKIIEDLQSSMDLLFVVIPIFDRYGNLEKIVSWREKESYHPDPKLLELMPYANLSALINAGKIHKQNPTSIINSYLASIPFKQETKIEIIRKFMEEKYASKSLDFNDMDFQYLMLFSQFPELREKIHKKILHIQIDEMQDSSTNQFLVGIFSDRDSFEKFCEFKRLI